MLARYTIHRGKRPSGDPLPEGRRLNTRRHTSHCLRPDRELVVAYLEAPTDASWRRFAETSFAQLAERFARDPPSSWPSSRP